LGGRTFLLRLSAALIDVNHHNCWRHVLLHVAVFVAVELLILGVKLALGLPLL
jgi:hypothetical protein